jgi:hypothetical protein
MIRSDPPSFCIINFATGDTDIEIFHRCDITFEDDESWLDLSELPMMYLHTIRFRI